LSSSPVELQASLADELPSQLQDGGTIRDGYDAELDQTRSLTRDSQQWLSEYELSEQARSGIKNLRIRYNGAFGYFIEVTKGQLAHVPEDYVRKQTMKNAERFTTTILKEREQALLRAEETALARESVLFQTLIARILEEAEALRTTAHALAQLDVLIGWSVLAREWDYCKPTVDNSEQLHIEQGRHPGRRANAPSRRLWA
jgi:DNA mismatch repair protein MutS